MTSTARGRPRDQAIDAAILAAARELVTDGGYAAMSMDAIASRAGVSKPTLYRRWPSRGALLIEAAFGEVPQVDPPDTGDIANDFKTTFRWGVAHVADPVGRVALPALLAEAAENPVMREMLGSRLTQPAFARIVTSLERAQQRGQVREGVDLLLVLEACTGAVIARLTMTGRPIDDAFADELVELIMLGLTSKKRR
ncbi:MAG TPA: TetR/AcrR family transcriptional regulator [Sporichthyaceae bacterium]|nr:TetR/AcrR family transcriptional regulator [Sporichthyaceae bacterium]